MTSNWDVIIVGAGLAGLGAASSVEPTVPVLQTRDHFGRTVVQPFPGCAAGAGRR